MKPSPKVKFLRTTLLKPPNYLSRVKPSPKVKILRTSRRPAGPGAAICSRMWTPIVWCGANTRFMYAPHFSVRMYCNRLIDLTKHAILPLMLYVRPSC